jgi:hypothetical protein
MFFIIKGNQFTSEVKIKNNTSMKVSIIKKAILEGIPSASGMEVIDGIIYVVGDNSPYLFILDQSLSVINKVELYKQETVSGIVPKATKPDLECMAKLSINNYKHLLILSSGSKSPYRDLGILVKLPTNYNRKHLITTIQMGDLYDLLRSNEEVVGSGQLNLEGAATSKENLILFNRSSGGSNNVSLYFKLEEFVEYLQSHTEMTPFPSIYQNEIPCINNIPGGFSGADVFEEKIFFTSTVENTPNAIDDGEVLGSFVGWMKVNESSNLKGDRVEPNKVIDCIQVMENGNPYLGKIESICIYEKEGENKYIALAVTDSDGAESELLMLEIEI